MRRRGLIFLVGVFTTTAIRAQVETGQKKIVRSNQQWLQYTNSAKLSHRWVINSDLNYRFKEELKFSSQYLVRTCGSYYLSPNLYVSAGFAHLGFYTSDKISRYEFRPYQELDWKPDIGKLHFKHRIRVEQRYFEQVENGQFTGEDSFNHRFRYLLFLDYPLLTNSENHGYLSFHLSNEILVNAAKDNAPTIFDQNRLVFGPSLHLSKKLTFNLHYMSFFASTNTEKTFRQNDTFWLVVKHKI